MTGKSKLFLFLKLFRLKHSVKNVLIFIPLVFSRGLLSYVSCIQVMLYAFVAFTLVASCIYIFNDIADRERDALHPSKCKRPIASGLVKPSVAWILSVTLGVVGLALAAWVASYTCWSGFGILLLYLLLNIAYSIGLKSVPIVEIGILSSGFLLRILYGGLTAGVEVSDWLYLTVLSFSLYLGLGKRRNELQRNASSSTRKVLKSYTRRFLDRNMYMFLASGLCFYSLWSIGQEKAMLWSVPMVMLLSMRYSLIVESGSDGDPVELILKDKMLLVLGFFYAIYMLVALYTPYL